MERMTVSVGNSRIAKMIIRIISMRMQADTLLSFCPLHWILEYDLINSRQAIELCASVRISHVL
jgi:hypothetical protein